MRVYMRKLILWATIILGKALSRFCFEKRFLGCCKHSGDRSPFSYRVKAMNESIYNLVPREQYVPEKKPMYHSKNDMKASVPGSTFGKYEALNLVHAEDETNRIETNI